MLRKVKVLGLIVGHIFLKLLSVKAEYDHSVEISDFSQVSSARTLDASILSNLPEVTGLPSSNILLSSTTSSALSASFHQPFVTNIDASAGYSLPVIPSSDPSSIFKPLSLSTVSSSASPFSTSGYSISINSNSALSSESSGTFESASASNFQSSNSFTGAVLSVPSIQNLLHIRLPGPTAADVLYNVAFKILTDLGSTGSSDPASASTHGGSSMDVLTVPLFFQVVGNTLHKFLLSEGIQIDPFHSENYAASVENALKYADINSLESVYLAFAYGGVNFLQSLGFNILDKAPILVQFFNAELTAPINV